MNKHSSSNSCLSASTVLVQILAHSYQNRDMFNKSPKFGKGIGRKIQKARKNNTKYSQEDLADVLRISRTHIGHIEQGRRMPSLELLEKIARALKVSPKDLL